MIDVTSVLFFFSIISFFDVFHILDSFFSFRFSQIMNFLCVCHSPMTIALVWNVKFVINDNRWKIMKNHHQSRMEKLRVVSKTLKIERLKRQTCFASTDVDSPMKWKYIDVFPLMLCSFLCDSLFLSSSYKY